MIQRNTYMYMQEEIERPRVEVSLESFDFLVASTNNSNLEDLLFASRRLAKLHPGLKVGLRIGTH